MRIISLKTSSGKRSLNPCFNGTYSMSLRGEKEIAEYIAIVLILVLMEHTL